MQGPQAFASTTPPTSPRIFDYRNTDVRFHRPEINQCERSNFLLPLPANTHVSVSLDGGTNLLRAGRDRKLSLALQAFIQSLLGHRGGAAHVFIAGVGAAANEPYMSGEEILEGALKNKF